MRRSFLLLVAAAALPALSATAWGQAPREQRMAFGGGGRFEFSIPANAAGSIYVEATWSPGASMHASLFSPDHTHPIVESDGVGRLIVTSPVTRWQVDKPWTLRIAANGRGANLRGNLRVVYPAGNRPGAVVQWRNAGPTDVAVLGQINRRIDALRQNAEAMNLLTSASPGDVVLVGSASTSTAEIIEALQTRVDILVSTPARFVRNDAGMGGAAAGTSSGLAGTRTLAVGFSQMRVISDSPFHSDHERDADYVVTALIPTGSSEAVCGRTPVMRSLETGDVVTAANGGQELARTGTSRARLAVAVLEREDGNPDLAMARFHDAAELYRLYSTSAGADADFAWFTDVAMAGVGERIIGTPMLLQVTENGIVGPSGLVAAWSGDGNGGRLATPRLGFSGGGAKVDVALNVHSND